MFVKILENFSDKSARFSPRGQVGRFLIARGIGAGSGLGGGFTFCLQSAAGFCVDNYFH